MLMYVCQQKSSCHPQARQKPTLPARAWWNHPNASRFSRSAANDAAGATSAGGSTLTPFLSRLGLVTPAGLLNGGNTCYLNAVLQALLSVPSFVQDLKRAIQKHASAAAAVPAAAQSATPAPAPTAVPDAFAVCTALLQCADKLAESTLRAQSSGSSCGKAVDPSILRRAMGVKAPVWRSSQQQDAHEFLCALLDQVQAEILNVEARAQLKQQQQQQREFGGQVSGAGASNDVAFRVTAAGCNGGAATAPLQSPAAAETSSPAADGPGPTPMDCSDDPPSANPADRTPANEAAAGAPSHTMSAPAAAASSPPPLVGIPLATTACPSGRNFSGCLQHDLRCSACGHESRVTEQFLHLSLQVGPAPEDEEGSSPPDLQALLVRHLQVI